MIEDVYGFDACVFEQNKQFLIEMLGELFESIGVDDDKDILKEIKMLQKLVLAIDGENLLEGTNVIK